MASLADALESGNTNSTMVRLLHTPARRTPREGAVILAHGAGAPMDSPFLEVFAKELADRGIEVLRFEFPYMAGRREGKRRGPDRPDVLRQTWLEAISEAVQLGVENPVIGGKSLGGRIASMVADEANVAGLLCLGYPFHPPGTPERLRTAHLATLRTKSLILQGERDPFGTKEEVATYSLSAAIEIGWIPDGDHSFKPRKSSGRTENENVALAIEKSATFITSVI